MQQSRVSKAGLRVPYDIIGDIAVLKIFDEPTARDLRSMARVIMSRDRHIKTVLYQASPVGGRFRTRKLVWVLGQRKTSTVHKEYGCLFSVDLSRVYFSPRLLYERMRIARLVQPGEVVVNMFAGVGCFSIIIA
ncbi:TPA: class I SAM-dependent methyltransferase family protein, partial [Candidatus Bathyarchaeota archaeon]|nr:class I SAM-dependent methyltransferase family protein [Candidatus Bathyarchaeota archaeon]